MKKLKQMAKTHRAVFDYFMIITGTGMMAVASVLFFDPCGMVPGGFTGMAIIVKEVSKPLFDGGIPLWFTNLVLNVPLIPVCIKLKGWNFIKRTLFAFIMFSVWLAIIPEINLKLENDLLLMSLFGGVIMGAGIGLVFLARATTGGTDMCGAIIQHYMPHISLPKLMQGLDIVIVCLGFLTFGIRMSLYSIIAIYLTSRISEQLMEGLTFTKMVYIISDDYDRIAAEIMGRLERGVTSLQGRGMYTEKEKQVLLCVVSPREIVAVKEIVYQIDGNAFVIVSDSKEVLGEGFVEYSG